MEFITDMMGAALGSVTPGDFADTIHDAHGAFAGQVVHGLGGGPDMIHNSLGQTTGYINHFGGQDTVTNSLGQTKFAVQHGIGGGPDLIHDSAGAFMGAIQHGMAPGMPDTLLDANWQGVAQSFGVQGLQGF